MEIRIAQQSINITARDPNYVDILEFIQVKMHITSLIILAAGVFTKPGTALRIDQGSCASKSPWTEPVKPKNSLYSAYSSMLIPAIQTTFDMINAVVPQGLGTRRVARLAQYIFGNNVGSLSGSIFHLQNANEWIS